MEENKKDWQLVQNIKPQRRRYNYDNSRKF